VAEEIFGWPRAVITSILDWSRYVFSPLSLVRESILKNLHNDVSVLVYTYWLFPILLIIATDAVVLHFYGIEFKIDQAFTLLYLAFACLKLFFGAFILFGVLRIMRVKVTQGIVFLCFSIVVMYAPLFSWIGVPQAVHLYDVLTLLKAQNLGAADTLSYFWHHAREINETLAQPLPAIAPYLTMVSYAISLLSSMLVAECLAQMLEMQRPRAYIASAIASVLNYVPAILLGLFQIILVFAYIRDKFAVAP
jgi:hypothetical protein